MTKKLLRFLCAGVVGLGLGLSSGPVPLAAAQTAKVPEAKPEAEQKDSKNPSDRAVRVIMSYAFAAIPDELPKRDGEVVKIDRNNPEKFMIPIEDARQIIRLASLSARADLCGLKDLERKHFGNIMKHERTVKKRTSYQILFIELMHATTGLVMTGSVQVGEDAAKPDDQTKDARNEYVCSPQERERVKAAVEADIKALASAQ